MSNLDKAQLTALTERVTARLGEWGKLAQYMPDVSAGLVRLVVDEYHDWLDEQERDIAPFAAWVGKTLQLISPDADQLQDAYHAGYQRGKASASPPDPTPRQVTNSAPVPDDDQGDPPPAGNGNGWRVELDPAQGRYREYTPWEDSAADIEAVQALVDDLAAKINDPDPPPAEAAEKPAAPKGFPLPPAPADAPAPDKPVGRPRDPRVPTPDVGRERIATALATSTNGLRSLVGTRARTLADVDGGEEVKGLRMDAATRADQFREIIHELQDMAVDDVMPSQNAWNLNKPAHLPTFSVILSRYDLTGWGELADRAKLRYLGKGNRPPKQRRGKAA